MLRKFNPTASYNGTEKIIRNKKEIVKGCVGFFNKEADTLLINFIMFDSEYQKMFKPVLDSWFDFLSYTVKKYKNPDYWNDEDNCPYINQEEHLHEVSFLIDKEKIEKIKERSALLAYGSDCPTCKYSDFYDVFNTIFWTSDDSITTRWKHFHEE